MGKEYKPAVVAIGVGSASVRVLAARESNAGEMEVLSAGSAPSLGVQRGIVTNAEDAAFAIRAAVEDAKLEGSLKGHVLYVTIGGKHLESLNQSGQAWVSRSDRIVSDEDVSRAIGASKGIAIADDQQIVHAIPRSFRVDGVLSKRSPIGSRGANVGAESHIVTGPRPAMERVRKAVRLASREPDGLIVGSLAAGHALLTQEEKDRGSLLIDIGAGTTEVVAYCGGAPFHTVVLPVGGNQIASDLATLLNTPTHVAERLYLEEGSVETRGFDIHEEILVRCFGPTGNRIVRRGFLNDVIRARVEEIVRMAHLRAREMALDLPFEGRVVLAGGVANLRGLGQLASESLETSVRIGSPGMAAGGRPELNDPCYAAVLGVARVGLDSVPEFLPSERQEASRGIWRLPQAIFGSSPTGASPKARTGVLGLVKEGGLTTS